MNPAMKQIGPILQQLGPIDSEIWVEYYCNLSHDKHPS